jgi:hypothetical protein
LDERTLSEMCVNIQNFQQMISLFTDTIFSSQTKWSSDVTSCGWG